MKTPLKLLGIALAVVLVATGFVAAGFGPGAAPADGEETTTDTSTDVGPVADADHPMNESNSTWVTGDEHLGPFQDRLQDRLGLTDAEMEEIRAEITASIQDGADRDEVRTQVRTMLENYGVEDPTLGTMDGAHPGDGPLAGSGNRSGMAGHGPWAGNGHGGSTEPGSQGGGPHGMAANGSQGTGPHGPADGSCTN